MRILPVQTHQYNRQYNPRFTSNCRSVFSESGDFLYKTTTYIFRSDLNWNRFAKALINSYKSADKVNVICHACSNGHEPYSLVVKLIHEAGAAAGKFFPVIAKDINSDNIASAKRGRLGIANSDMYRINYYTNDKINNFFEFGRAENPANDLVLVPKADIKNKVIFSQADILNDIDSIPPSNTVLMCRNFWPYLTSGQRKTLAQKISQRLDKTSLVVLGSYELGFEIDELLKENGFRSTDIRHVLAKG